MCHGVEAAFRVELVHICVLPVGVLLVVELVVLGGLELHLHHFIKHLLNNHPIHRSSVILNKFHNLALCELEVMKAESIKI